MTTLALLAQKRREVHSPMPLAPPVMIATFPSGLLEEFTTLASMETLQANVARQSLALVRDKEEEANIYEEKWKYGHSSSSSFFGFEKKKKWFVDKDLLTIIL